VRLVVVI
jgi:hypothetical protein